MSILDKIYLGNDIIEIADEYRHPAMRNKFINRTCTTAEKDYIYSNNNPGNTMLYFWAAKEAAYKAFSRHDASIVFSPREFEVNTNLKSVMYNSHKLEIEAVTNNRYIHVMCFGYEMERKRIFFWVNNKNDDIQHKQAYTLSDLVRLQLKTGILSVIPDVSIEQIVLQNNSNHYGKIDACILHIKGRDISLVVSFSHHENYIASCVYIK